MPFRRPALALLFALALCACARTAPAADGSAAVKAFLARNAAAPGMHVTQSGL